MTRNDVKIVIVGRNGQLAWELQRALASLGSVTSVGRPEVDLTNPDSVRTAVRELRPDVLVNAAAYTSVDLAESEPEIAMKTNVEGPRALAEEAKKIGSLLVTYSSDYVFDGKKAISYTESDAPNPLNTYGASKLAGDRAVEDTGGAYLIFRTSWVYGARGKNFLNTILKLGAEREELRIVDDQVGAPTWSREIAIATGRVVQNVLGTSGSASKYPAEKLGARRGIYNMTAGGRVSWHGFATAILEEAKKHAISPKPVARIVAIPTSEYPTPARRPTNSSLANEKLKEVFGTSLGDWRDSVTRVIEQIAQQHDPIHQQR